MSMGEYRNFFYRIVIYGLSISSKKYDNVCTFATKCQCAHSRDICGVYFSRCFATREINTQITNSWTHKQFVTPTHRLSCNLSWTRQITSSTIEISHVKLKIIKCLFAYLFNICQLAVYFVMSHISQHLQSNTFLLEVNKQEKFTTTFDKFSSYSSGPCY